MNDFIARYQDQLSGTLTGFDRLVFLGTLWRNRLEGERARAQGAAAAAPPVRVISPAVSVSKFS